ncbi:vacuolar protein sorting-associated protein 41 homolog [Planococcus citri]|uniref:vacuolar protein sorting-associated protein 41 homolog n=1 Tax=Planococcus citri TaxID=170843 RepID=UPI0031F9422B
MVEVMNDVDNSEVKLKSDDNSEAEDDSSSASTDEIEPKLKYERLSNDIQEILQKDSVSCVAFHPKIICIGTRWGLVHVLDHQGNIIHNEHLKTHTVAVNQISMDAKGEFIATCSDDGKAYVYGLYTTDNGQEISLGRCIKSIAIDPLYYKSGINKRFVSGDDRLILHEKTFLSRVKSTILYEAAGRVQNIKWHNRFIAWASDEGVRVYDIVDRVSLALIKWNRVEDVIPENYRCSLMWKNSVTLLAGWVDTVRVCRIEKRNSVIKDIPEFNVALMATIKLEYFISGICPLDTAQLVVLAYEKLKDENGKSLRPLMYMVQADNSTSRYVEVYTDNLTLRGYQDYTCNDYHLDCLLDENRYIIAGPKDVIIASVYDFDDRIEWLVAHNKYEEAMDLVMNKNRYLQRNTPLLVGKKYVDHLINLKDFAKAAELCSKIFGKDRDLWEKEVFRFARSHQLRTISKYLPIDPKHKLQPQYYEMVLYEFLKMEPENFLKILKEWPPKLYNIHAVINAVLERVVNDSNYKQTLLEALAILYTHSEQYDKALNMYLKLKHKDVFQLIHKHNLYDSVHGDIENLMDLDTQQAISLFLGNNSITTDHVVSRLAGNAEYLYLYLDALDTKDHKSVGGKYHDQLVKLYAKFAPQKLLPLLRRSDSYPIQEALRICRERNLYPEMVYLLGRIGNTKEALKILINKIGDMEQAISFCKEHSDPDLWEELVDHSLSKPEFITYLLQKIGSYIDPRILVKRIDNKMKIPGLKNALVKMLRDYNLQVSVQEGCKNIVVSDCFDLHYRLVKMQQRGISVDDDLFCSVCHQKVIIRNSSVEKNVLIFYCRHSFHEECLPSIGTMEKCIICCSQKST